MLRFLLITDWYLFDVILVQCLFTSETDHLVLVYCVFNVEDDKSFFIRNTYR